MKYRLKGSKDTSIIILDEREENLSLMVVRYFNGYREEKTEMMTKDIFDMCLRTGYLQPIEEAVAV